MKVANHRLHGTRSRQRDLQPSEMLIIQTRDPNPQVKKMQLLNGHVHKTIFASFLAFGSNVLGSKFQINMIIVHFRSH
jgi:hypothetical protein